MRIVFWEIVSEILGLWPESITWICNVREFDGLPWTWLIWLTRLHATFSCASCSQKPRIKNHITQAPWQLGFHIWNSFCRLDIISGDLGHGSEAEGTLCHCILLTGSVVEQRAERKLWQLGISESSHQCHRCWDKTGAAGT